MKKLNILAGILTLFFVLLLAACGGSGGAVNNAPVATDAGISLPPGTSVTSTLVASDIDANDLTFSIVAYPGNGAVSITDTATGAYSYTHDGTANGDSFTFWVNDGLLDSNIATVTVTTTPPATPGTGLQAIAGDQRITLNWDAVSGADSYNIYWNDLAGIGTGDTKITGVTSPFYHDNLVNGGNYYYVVTSVNAVGESDISTGLTATPVDIAISSLTFTDVNLAGCVENKLGLSVYVHDLTSLDCSNENITDLGGIEALTSLTYLYLYSNSITDVSPLSGLTGLTKMNLTDNSISDIGVLSGLIGLTYLDLRINLISDLSVLSGLISLTDLYLNNNTISDLSALSGLTGLITLTLNDNTVTGVVPLAGLTNLTSLNLSSNSIIDVSPLTSLINLTWLSLDDNGVVDVSPLSNLLNMDWLFLVNNSIGGLNVGNVDALITLTSATAITLSGNIGMSCVELTTLIAELGSPPVDTDGSTGTTDVATDGVNCTDL